MRIAAFAFEDFRTRKRFQEDQTHDSLSLSLSLSLSIYIYIYINLSIYLIAEDPTPRSQTRNKKKNPSLQSRKALIFPPLSSLSSPMDGRGFSRDSVWIDEIGHRGNKFLVCDVGKVISIYLDSWNSVEFQKSKDFDFSKHAGGIRKI
eukprot:TRINITY_DN12157_c2_g2_i4.p1 TRINITY_DN12157_c2_g2~~TRINITY_DN12157_c2_g2_i4.p1  ORF type:complete len:148 (-),score=23.99 TRINITY_DN12157_c2_g2_i4:80-523(-)